MELDTIRRCRRWLLRLVLGGFWGLSLGGTGATAIVGALIALVIQGPAESSVLLVVGIASLAAGLTVLVFLAGPQVHAWRNPVVPGAKMVVLRHGPPGAESLVQLRSPRRHHPHSFGTGDHPSLRLVQSRAHRTQPLGHRELVGALGLAMRRRHPIA